jgi:hypothetical protein
MKKVNRIVNTMKKSGGRFFGLRTKHGASYNAQFVNETPSYVVIHDRNAGVKRKFAKTSLSGLKMGTVSI